MMTIDHPVELERLSKAATQGVWRVSNQDDDATQFNSDKKPVAIIAEHDSTETVACNTQYYPTPILEEDAAFIVALVNAYRTGQLVPAQPSGDVVEAVARAIYDAEDSQSGDHVGTVIYNSEHLFAEVRDGETEVDATKRTAMQVCRDAARAAITTYEAASGVAKMREALKKIATVDESGLAEYTPQAMVAIARAALGEKP